MVKCLGPLDALGLATVDCITSAATAGLPFAASLSSSSMTEEDIMNLRTFQRLVLLLSGVPKNESSNTGVKEANPYKSQRRNSGEEASLVLYQFASVQEILPLLSVILELHRNRATLTDEQLEVHTISAWKEGKSQQYGEAVRAAQLMFGRPLIWASPDESLKDVALMILQNKISTVPIIYSTIEESCPLLLHIACLGGILKFGWLCQVI